MGYAQSPSGSVKGARDWLQICGVRVPPELQGPEDWGDAAEEARKRYVGTFGEPEAPKPKPRPPPKPKPHPPIKEAPCSASIDDDHPLRLLAGKYNTVGYWRSGPRGDVNELSLERLHLGLTCPLAYVDESHGRRRPPRNRFRWQRRRGKLKS